LAITETDDSAIAAAAIIGEASLLLTVFEQMSHDEAASMLGVTAKAIETRVHRAKRKLRSMLSGSPDA
jgi:DNA-directed RNA polymerase specialized sigma24 family protein